MSKRLRIVTICGCGVGSSVMLKVNLEEVLKKVGLEADIVPADVTTAYGEKCDIVITQEVFKHALKGATYKEVIFLKNLASKKELEEKLIPVLQKMGYIQPS